MRSFIRGSFEDVLAMRHHSLVGEPYQIVETKMGGQKATPVGDGHSTRRRPVKTWTGGDVNPAFPRLSPNLTRNALGPAAWAQLVTFMYREGPRGVRNPEDVGCLRR